jgi:hypothetical protein
MPHAASRITHARRATDDNGSPALMEMPIRDTMRLLFVGREQCWDLSQKRF